VKRRRIVAACPSVCLAAVWVGERGARHLFRVWVWVWVWVRVRVWVEELGRLHGVKGAMYITLTLPS